MKNRILSVSEFIRSFKDHLAARIPITVQKNGHDVGVFYPSVEKRDALSVLSDIEGILTDNEPWYRDEKTLEDLSGHSD